jgi:hypothetical protein
MATSEEDHCSEQRYSRRNPQCTPWQQTDNILYHHSDGDSQLFGKHGHVHSLLFDSFLCESIELIEKGALALASGLQQWGRARIRSCSFRMSYTAVHYCRTFVLGIVF